MFNLKKETIKKNIFLTVSIISAFTFIASIMCTIMGDLSPVKFIVNESPVKLVVPPVIVFLVSSVLYRNSKQAMKGNTK